MWNLMSMEVVKRAGLETRSRVQFCHLVACVAWSPFWAGNLCFWACFPYVQNRWEGLHCLPWQSCCEGWDERKNVRMPCKNFYTCKVSLFTYKFSIFVLNILTSIFFKDFIYLFMGDTERERERESSNRLPVEPNTELDPRTLRSWPEPKSRASRLTDWATQGPLL